MFFTPFAFIQQPYAVEVIPVASLRGYYIGGAFTGYRVGSDPYFRMLDSTGSISSSFNIGAGFSAAVDTAVTQSDGKIIVGGEFTTYSGSASPRIVRLNTDGTKDITFNPGTAGANGAVYGSVIQPDSKLIIVGNFTAYSGSTKNRVIRINTDGTADTGSSWNQGAGANNVVNAVAFNNNYLRTFIGGTFTSYSGSTATRIACINSDGTAAIAPQWNSGGGFASTVNAMQIQIDDRILVGGAFTTYSGSSRSRIARVNINGTLDTSFNVGTGCNSNVNSIAIQSDGKIIIGGGFTTYSGSTRNYIARINTDGTADGGSSWNTGVGFNSTVGSIGIQPDGKIVVIGNFTAYSGSLANGVVRLNTDGTLDTTFERIEGIQGVNNNISIVLPLSNDSTVIGSNFTGNKRGYGTFMDSTGGESPTGSIASSGLDLDVRAGVPLPDSSVLLVGAFSTYSGSVAQGRILRLNGDGTQYTGSSWNTGAGFNATVTDAITQSDGKIVAVGGFTTYSGSSNSCIVRLNTDGTKDSTLNMGVGFNSTAIQVKQQSDGKLVVGGGFISYSGSTKNYIARLNTDGTADTGSSWNQGVGFGNVVNSVGIQSDGKIVAGGVFTTYSGSVSNNTRIIRLNTDGTKDTTFNPGTAGFGGAVQSVVVQSDGKILVGGQFTTYSGSTKNYIARLNTDGTADTGSSWNQGVGFNNLVYYVTQQSDGKLIVGGAFTAYSGSAAYNVVRLNTNGTRDTTFTLTGSGFNSNVLTVLPYYN